MKKLILATLAIAIVIGCETTKAQVSPVYIPLTSQGGHTRGATANTVNSWTWASIKQDTISNFDTNYGGGIFGALIGPLGGTRNKPFVLQDSIKLNGSYKSGSIQITLTKVSGTVADTAWLLVSNDGINYVQSGQDTVVFGNVTYPQTYLWEIPGRQKKSNSAGTGIPQIAYYTKPDLMPYLFYKVFVRSKVGGTASSAVVKCFFMGRQ